MAEQIEGAAPGIQNRSHGSNEDSNQNLDNDGSKAGIANQERVQKLRDL